jgi:BirA family biotin operon repressor/biotin-[acetyl-CoA-carboxylase] ligase
METYPQTIYLKETPSTNLYLREHLQKEPLPEGSIVIAESQTAGRGQAGNSWVSAPGANLTFSLLLYPYTILANRQFILSQIVSLAVKETLDAHIKGISIKWPNDIYWHDKKICGILIENNLSGERLHSSIVGIGINLNQTQFAGSARNPVSLRQITGKAYVKEDILNHFLHNFYKHYLQILQGNDQDVRRAYQAALYHGNGKFYAYADAHGLFEARIQEVEPTGHLALKLRNGEIRRYAFKEVSYQ